MIKLCTSCHEAKPSHDFWKDRSRKDGLQVVCKDCTLAYKRRRNRIVPLSARKDQNRRTYARRTLIASKYSKSRKHLLREKSRKSSLAYYYRHKERIQKRRKSKGYREARLRWILKNVYGLSVEQYQTMVSAQSSRCAICRSKLKRLDVDHDHRSKTVRGLLCNRCNRGIGYFNDSPMLLIKAAKYLSTDRKRSAN